MIMQLFYEIIVYFFIFFFKNNCVFGLYIGRFNNIIKIRDQFSYIAGWIQKLLN